MKVRVSLPPRVTGREYAGNIRVLEDFYSATLDNQRHIWIYLPPSYESSTARAYPVLYAQDGQNVFAGTTAFGGVEWALDEAAETLIEEGRIEEPIIVAVSNTADRLSEYTHVPDPIEGGGNLERYATFLIDELKPVIDATFRTLTGPEHTAIMGSSLGGLSATWLGWFRSETFGRVAALSPSYWWADRELTARIVGHPRRKGPRWIYIDMGTVEGSEPCSKILLPEAIRNAREMGDVHLSRGYVYGHNLLYSEIAGASHNEQFWSQRVGLILMALYGTVGETENEKASTRAYLRRVEAIEAIEALEVVGPDQ